MPSPDTLRRLQITHVRNLKHIRLDALERVNVFFGPNGAGKTSVLEALHLLGMARSFRGSTKSLITHGSQACTVYGQFASGNLDIGVNREMNGNLLIKLAGNPVRAIADLVEVLPLQVITAETFELLTGPPGGRRRFLDWGVFHVEHAFFPQWQRYQRALKQRNYLLRRGKMGDSQLPVWTRESAESGTILTEHRKAYFKRLESRFLEFVELLLPDMSGLEIRFRRGWNSEMTLHEAIDASLQSDFEQGYTHVGPQRADIKVLVEGKPAAEVLSRGQKKMVVCSLKLAQGKIMSEDSNKNCIYLVDDLPAELDQHHAGLVCEALSSLPNTQVFITCIEKDDIAQVWPETETHHLKMFHVEHGRISPV